MSAVSAVQDWGDRDTRYEKTEASGNIKMIQRKMWARRGWKGRRSYSPGLK